MLTWGTFNLPQRVSSRRRSSGIPGSSIPTLNNRYLYEGAPNSRAFPAFVSADMVVYKTVTVRKRAADLGMQVFNLTNHRNPRDVYPVVGTPLTGPVHQQRGAGLPRVYASEMVRRFTRVRVRTALVVLLAIVCRPAGSARALPVEQTAAVRAEFIDRFLAPDEPPLVSYRAFRHLAASTRGGKMRASIDAWTTLDPVRGFTFESHGQRRLGAYPGQSAHRGARSRARRRQGRRTAAQSALTPANYDFLDISPEDGRLVKMDVRPKRKHVMLVNGALFIEAESADLVRVEGELSKRPSFWTRRVRVVREYDRVEGVHVPVSMSSTADVLIVGASTFSMTYRYAEINGKPIPEHE